MSDHGSTSFNCSTVLLMVQRGKYMLSARGLAHRSIILGTIATLALYHLAGLTISVRLIEAVILFCFAMSGILVAVYVPRSAVMAQVAAIIECVSLLSLGSIIGGLASYPLAALSSGWLDEDLLAGDRLLGLDWLTYWYFVQAHPLTYHALGFAYGSIFISPMILVITLISMGNMNHAYRFVATFLIALLITDISLEFVPGKSAAEHFLPLTAHNLPSPGLLHVPIIERLRAGSFGPVQITHLDGLIAFPSFHAAAAVIFAWAAWPIRWLRVPAIILYGLMVAATPIQGGHYFVDSLAGCAVAAFAIAVVRRLPPIRSVPTRDTTSLTQTKQANGQSNWQEAMH